MLATLKWTAAQTYAEDGKMDLNRLRKLAGLKENENQAALDFMDQTIAREMEYDQEEYGDEYGDEYDGPENSPMVAILQQAKADIQAGNVSSEWLQKLYNDLYAETEGGMGYGDLDHVDGIVQELSSLLGIEFAGDEYGDDEYDDDY